MLPDGSGIICMIWAMFPGLDLYYTDPAQPLTTAGEELDGLDHDLSHLSVRGGKTSGLILFSRENDLAPAFFCVRLFRCSFF